MDLLSYTTDAEDLVRALWKDLAGTESLWGQNPADRCADRCGSLLDNRSGRGNDAWKKSPYDH